jgi:hypothetical protein
MASKNDRYRQTAESIREDCFSIDPAWLIDRHPELWQRIVLIDLQLTKLEQKGAEQGEYEMMLTRLVQTVKKARALYEQENQQKAAVQ